MDSILEIKNLVKSYGSGEAATKALNDVSFTMKQGEFTAVMGASGSGKIVLEGRNVAGFSEKELSEFRRDRLGFIFQDYNLLETLTVAENIILPLNLQKKPVKETMVLFCFLLDIPGEMFTYSLKATVLMIGIGALIFLFASFFSMRYLKKAEIKELMSETYEEQGAKRPAFWCVLSLVLFAGILLCAVKTYDSLIESFGIQSSIMLFVWMRVLLVLIFLFHLALARGLFGTLMQKKKTAWQRTNTVILRGLSGRMTTNSVLIGVFAVLLTFSVIASNIYLSAVFVCMALAILAMKTLSSLSEERRRFEVLYRLGVDSAMQKQTLFRQTAAFFFLPLCLPVLFCAAMGVACGKVYALWGFPETSYLAWIIAVVMLGSYALYFAVTYRAVCRYVVCEGGWDD